MVQQLTTEQRNFVVTKYLETKSIKSVQVKLRQSFPNRNVPAKQTSQQKVFKYKRYGTSLNWNKGNSGRRRTIRTQANIKTVQQRLLVRPDEVTSSKPQFITNAFAAMRTRANTCLQNNDRQVERL